MDHSNSLGDFFCFAIEVQHVKDRVTLWYFIRMQRQVKYVTKYLHV